MNDPLNLLRTGLKSRYARPFEDRTLEPGLTANSTEVYLTEAI